MASLADGDSAEVLFGHALHESLLAAAAEGELEHGGGECKGEGEVGLVASTAQRVMLRWMPSSD